jgi:hypothetical protein
MKLARFGDNLRFVAVTEGDKTEAEIGFGLSANTWGVNDLVEAVDTASDADIDALVAEYKISTTSCPSFVRAASVASRCATARPRSWASDRFSRVVGSAPSPTASRTSRITRPTNETNYRRRTLVVREHVLLGRLRQCRVERLRAGQREGRPHQRELANRDVTEAFLHDRVARGPLSEPSVMSMKSLPPGLSCARVGPAWWPYSCR